MKLRHTESNGCITVTIPQRSGKYIDEMLRCICLSDLLTLKLFPNAKEITESFAAYCAVRTYCKELMFNDPTIRLVDVACGHAPRTAAVFAFRTKWQCIAIDPALSKTQYNVKRLTCYKSKIEDLELPYHHGITVITAVHAHIPLPIILDIIKSDKIVLIAIPCCRPLELFAIPDIEYEDFGIWSDKRLIKIWKAL